MNYKSYADLSIDILEEISKIPETIQLIAGVPRSGMVPAYIIGAQLNLPVVSIDSFCNGLLDQHGERKIKGESDAIKQVLVIDDSHYSGKAMLAAKMKLKPYESKYSITYAVIYSSTSHNPDVDFYLKHLPQPRVFQWNYKNHFITTQSAYDMDGVLCVDPTDKENDDGPNYKLFIENAKPLFLPEYKIPCIITSRLEKYRSATEKWLSENGVIYDTLIMLDLKTAEERQQLGIHAQFKANILNKRLEKYYIESNWEQAKQIFKLTNKSIFCTQNDVFIRSAMDIEYYENAKSYTDKYLNASESNSENLHLRLHSLELKNKELQQINSKLNQRIQSLNKSKWLQLSKLSFKERIVFIFKHMFGN